jgi:hypothetical protein
MMEQERKRNLPICAEDVAEGSGNTCFPPICGKRSSSQFKKPTSNADILLAREMNELSIDERERIFEEIHGISRVVDEDPAFVTECLAKLDEEISRIKKKSAFDQALFLCPKYVNDRKFRLMFLRSDNFEAEKASTRIVKHFERKLELFGTDKLVKIIQFNDLHEDDQSALLTGCIQFLRSKDRSGRTVVFNAQKHQNYKHWRNQVCT